MRAFSRLALVMLAASVSMGCGRVPNDGKSAVAGTVTWNGSPLPSGTVTLYSDKGIIDAANVKNGTFVIRTKPGAKSVSVTAEKELGKPPATGRIPNPSPVKHQYLPREWNVDSRHKQQITAESRTMSLAVTGAEVPPPADILLAQPD
jgi:hypothetical protein